MLVTGGIMRDLVKIAQFNVVDYSSLMGSLNNYKAPHRKITGFLKKGELIRVKKGLYVLGEELRTTPVNRMLLANLIYGPSYISQEYALQFYGLIPERVHTITSMTDKRNKIFQTPFGVFRYTYINQKQFSVGVDRLLIQHDMPVLIASPEKALCDCLKNYRDLKNSEDLQQHLFENMRLEKEELKEFDIARVEKISLAYRNPVVSLFHRNLVKGL